MNKLTGIEKTFLAAMWANLEASPDFNINNPQYWPGLQNIIRKTAYHEAGHFAARCFTMVESPFGVSISIIPEHGRIGSLNYDRAFTVDLLESSPQSFQRRYGRMLILEYLAGAGAEIITGLSEGFKSILHYSDKNNSHINGNIISDCSNAIRVTNIMATPYMTPYKNLQLLKKWTLEMLRIPEVWSIVENLAGKLIAQGTIVEDDICKIMAESDFPCIFDLPKWRRRLSITQ